MENKGRMTGVFVLAAAVFTGFLCAILMAGPSVQEKVEQKKIAEQLLRFHVLANSDSVEDQKEKIRVRDGVAEYVRVLTQTVNTKEEVVYTLEAHMDDIKRTAEKIAWPRKVRAAIEWDYFPVKRYGRVSLPEGVYEALRIEIGNARGHNWWCVLYPSLCFTKTELPAYNKEGEKQIRMILDQDAQDMVFHPVKARIRFWWMNNCLNSDEEQSKMYKANYGLKEVENENE